MANHQQKQSKKWIRILRNNRKVLHFLPEVQNDEHHPLAGFPEEVGDCRSASGPIFFLFFMEGLLFYRLLFLYLLFYKIEFIGVEKIEFSRVCKPNGRVQNQVALLVTGVASKKPILRERNSILVHVQIGLNWYWSSRRTPQ